MVFGRACGATLTTLNAKKIPLSSTGCKLPEAHKKLPGRSKGCLDAKNATLTLARGCPDAPEAVWTRQAHKRLPGRCRDCLEATTGSPDASLSAGIDNQDAPSSCQRLTRGCPDAAEAVWRRPRAARTTKKLLKSLQKRSSERLSERSEPQDAPGEA